MFGSVATSTHSIDDYIPIVGEAAVAALRELAEPLHGIRVLHLSSPGASGAVRNLLQSSVPLQADLGIEAAWQQVRVSSEFQEMDHQLRLALSGYAVDWPAKLANAWWQFNQSSAGLFDQEFDIVVVHHTGSVGLHAALTQMTGHAPAGVWLWDSHRDYRAAHPDAWSLIRRHADDFDVSIYDYKPFIRPDAPTRRKVVIPPGVDPLGPRSRQVSEEVRETILAQRGVDVTRPLLAQIVLSTRDDDPLRVLETYELAKREKPELQLIVAYLLSGPDQGESVDALRRRGRELGGVVVLGEMDGVGNVEVCALRDQAAVLLHQGLPRGISIELLEEMWQSKPVVSAKSSVAEAVLTQHRTGILADTPAEQATAVLRLLASPAVGRRMGAAAHRRIAEHYLVTRYLADCPKLFQQ
ncbi:MAG: glycosyltransferase, partial [Chloroflexi bacterium]|nr:glycosyltransferase [Chloroflexota bacterium]